MNTREKQRIGLLKPFTYQQGVITDCKGNIIIKANRDSETTPLLPMERDDLLKYITELLNQSL